MYPVLDRSCNLNAQTIRPIRHLLSMVLACSLILSMIDYCNAVFHGAPTGTNCSEFGTMQLGLCSRRRGDPTPSRYVHQLHWLPVQLASWQF